jgi:GTP-binding protein
MLTLKPTPELIETARKLFAGPCDFVAGVAALDQLPPVPERGAVPEVAFIGRSNVGKSSLINALTGRRDIARVSQTPGRTRQLNFFNIGGRVHLVDMPGYGYAKAPKDEIKEWNYLIKDYLRGRTVLQRVFVLVDARHGLKEIDEAFLKMMDESGVTTQVLLTKADAMKPAPLAAMVARTEAELVQHPAAFPRVLPISAEKNVGIELVRTEICALTGH